MATDQITQRQAESANNACDVQNEPAKQFIIVEKLCHTEKETVLGICTKVTALHVGIQTWRRTDFGSEPGKEASRSIHTKVSNSQASVYTSFFFFFPTRHRLPDIIEE